MRASISGITVKIFLSLGLFFFLLPSCEKLKEATQIDVEYDLPDHYFTLDSLSYLKTEKLLFSEMYTANIDSIINANDGSLEGVKFYKVRLSVVSPSGVTFDWLNSARATVTPAGGSPIEIATTTAVNTTARTVDFVIKNLDLASKINGQFRLDIYGNLNGPLPAGSVNMLLETGIKITVSPL